LTIPAVLESSVNAIVAEIMDGPAFYAAGLSQDLITRDPYKGGAYGCIYGSCDL